jgi:arabinogalactan oligomer/maltooligosaccharide transport system permease protein
MSSASGAPTGATVTAPKQAGEGRGAAASRPPGAPGVGLFVTYGLLILFNGLALWGLLRAIDQKSWVGVGVIVVGTALVDVVYATRRFIPGKYLVPGSIFLVLFAVFPVIYTVYLSFTNYGTGHLITKDQAVAQIEANSLRASPDATRYRADIMQTPDDELYLLLTDPTGAYFTGQGGTLEPADAAQVQTSESGGVTAYGDDVALTIPQKSDLSDAEKDALAVSTDTGLIQLTSLTEAAELEQLYQYDGDRGVMVDTSTGVEYAPVEGTFTNLEASPQTLDPGWTVGVGFDNYRELFTDPTLRESFVTVFVWTIAFSTLTVAANFALGLLLAMVFSNVRMHGRGVYRVLLILPYAIPTFMTILVWQGMMNTDFGILNEILNTNINWLGDTWWARFSVLLVNLWLSFPYMFLVCTGALQGIPTDLREAAFVDGATGMQAFRKITFPLLLIAVAPVLISSWAFAFNNYNVIELLTAGGPPKPGQIAGDTDILITFTTTVAFGRGGSDYGLATAISVIIFMVVALISSIGFRFTRVFEEVR